MTTANEQQYRTWMCLTCGFIYDESAGLPDEGIAPGTLWQDIPINWTCPECGARKEDFEMVEI
ncbi:MAG: rubredoxin [Candidatus Accumulibacter sp.]|uniref:rubredoxin n=1 Tax=Accumulibacter sp. TaxID=2053492 RepID=UPI001A0162D9|nr:rubredoxin [Accumulibacter sp.]MBE2258587.1 rubredoxin [Paracoccaceae bacterium]MCB1941075.1 rubredoxin [Accumulibacter sp.]MCP5248211.1 rubredoxin [Accumulibacter sp.]